MQIDIHHAATYVIARLAGFTHHEASTIAYASQYVNDCNHKGTIQFDDGTTYSCTASAHVVTDWDTRTTYSDYFGVWMPFHYLPGNACSAQDAYKSASLAERLVCMPDSPISNEMWQDCMSRKEESNSLQRLGIVSHVYCDTFSHQNFIGIRHPINHIGGIAQQSKYLDPCVGKNEFVPRDVYDRGHSGAHSLPDLPFAKWKALDWTGKVRHHDNASVFYAACKRLFRKYIHYLGRDPNTVINARDLQLIHKLIHSEDSANADFRHSVWMTSITVGLFSFGPLSDEEACELEYISSGPGSWEHDALGGDCSPDTVRKHKPTFDNSLWKKYQEALKSHQTFVVNQVFPKYQLPRSHEEAYAMGI